MSLFSAILAEVRFSLLLVFTLPSPVSRHFSCCTSLKLSDPVMDYKRYLAESEFRDGRDQLDHQAQLSPGARQKIGDNKQFYWDINLGA